MVAAFFVMLLLAFGGLAFRQRHNGDYQKKQNMNLLLQRFSQIGSDYNLSYTGQLVLKNGIIGIDGIRHQLVVLQNEGDSSYHSFVGNINNIKSCSVKKTYRTIPGGDLKVKRLDQFLQKIVLCFEFYDEQKTVEVLFYHHSQNTADQIPHFERQARDWKEVILKMRKPHRSLEKTT